MEADLLEPAAVAADRRGRCRTRPLSCTPPGVLRTAPARRARPRGTASRCGGCTSTRRPGWSTRWSDACADGGRIVLIGSRTSTGVAGKSQYAATKAALDGAEPLVGHGARAAPDHGQRRRPRPDPHRDARRPRPRSHAAAAAAGSAGSSSRPRSPTWSRFLLGPSGAFDHRSAPGHLRRGVAVSADGARGLVADDLTGAGDSAVGFAEPGGGPCSALRPAAAPARRRTGPTVLARRAPASAPPPTTTRPP